MTGVYHKGHTALALLAAGALFLMPTIPLGTNGQQIVINTGLATASVKISGDDQYGSLTHQTLDTPTQSTEDPGYWWKGWISISSYTGTGGTGSLLGTTQCDVPVNQSSNWVTCQAD